MGVLRLTMYGYDAEVIIMSRAEYRLARHMNEPEAADLDDLVLSPMSGTLISFAVKVSLCVTLRAYFAIVPIAFRM